MPTQKLGHQYDLWLIHPNKAMVKKLSKSECYEWALLYKHLSFTKFAYSEVVLVVICISCEHSLQNKLQDDIKKIKINWSQSELKWIQI